MRILLCGLFILLSACSLPVQQQADSEANIQPVVSPNDQRKYRLLTLPNHLQVLLISDVAADKAAASLDVAVGSGDDPLDRLGMAHYLEHMLFLGTAKYPNPDDYGDFISSHGGSQNAYTSFDHTNYFFDVAADHLEPALDRFAQFFIAPKFDPRYVEREINAVHSEYSSKMLDDFRRGYDVTKQVMNPKHPMSKFSVGSLQSLAADKDYKALREQLIDFYGKHYSANTMRLAVYGKEDLDQLQVWVEAKFSAVENKRLQKAPINVDIFRSEDLPLQVNIKPYREMRTLSVAFQLPDVSAEYANKPLSYVGNILGHEGEGSLLSYLKAQGWVDSLGAGVSLDYKGGSVFSISMDLTAAGEANIDSIVGQVFAAIKMLQRQGLIEALYLEQAAVSKQAFDTREQRDPISEVSQIVTDMHNFAPRDILQGHYLYNHFDRDRILELVAMMTPERMLLTVTSPDVETDQTSPYFEAPFKRFAISADRLSTIKSFENNLAIQPPKPNPFIAEHKLLPLEDGIQNTPVVIAQSDGLQFWYQQDDTFRIPKGEVIVRFSIPGPAMLDQQQAMALSMYADILRDRLNEFAYPAQMAGVSFAINGSQRGLDVTLGGFSSGHEALLRKVLASLAQQTIEPARFERIKNENMEGLQRALLDKPYRQVMQHAQQLLMSPSRDLNVALQLLTAMTPASLLQDVIDIQHGWQVEGLIYGNYSRQHAEQFAALFRPFIASQKPFTASMISVRDVACESFCEQSFKVQDNDTAVLRYIQGQGGDYPDRAALATLANMLQSPFFQSLRTEQQLGYIVGAYPYALHAYPGLALLVQSPNASKEEIQTAIDVFLADFVVQPESSMCEAYALSQQAVINQLRETPKNQSEQVHGYWQDIQYDDLGFDGQEQIAKAIETMNCSQWRDYVLPMLNSAYPGMLQINALGNNGNADEQTIDADSWQMIQAGRFR